MENCSLLSRAWLEMEEITKNKQSSPPLNTQHKDEKAFQQIKSQWNSPTTTLDSAGKHTFFSLLLGLRCLVTGSLERSDTSQPLPSSPSTWLSMQCSVAGKVKLCRTPPHWICSWEHMKTPLTNVQSLLLYADFAHCSHSLKMQTGWIDSGE